MTTYKTSEVAAIIGIHHNTVRLYEKLNLIPEPERLSNGYRVFTEFHIQQCRLIRLAFQVEVLQNGLRKKIAQMIRVSATGDFDTAIALTHSYLKQIQQERRNAEEAIEIVKHILSGGVQENSYCLKRKDVSELLAISMDTLRNWEMGRERSTEAFSPIPRIFSMEFVSPIPQYCAEKIETPAIAENKNSE